MTKKKIRLFCCKIFPLPVLDGDHDDVPGGGEAARGHGGGGAIVELSWVNPDHDGPQQVVLVLGGENVQVEAVLITGLHILQ